MLGRKTSGSVVCPSCGSLVGVNDDRCYTCGRVKPGMWGFAPLVRQFGSDLGLVPLVIAGCSIMFLASILLTARVRGGNPMSGLLSLDFTALFILGASGSGPVFGYGRWWTILSATWLHGGLLHLLMNMMSVRNLGPGTAEIMGPARTIVIYVVSGACGFLLSAFMGSTLTVGASAAICGLIGALVHYGRKSGSSAIYNQAIQWAIAILAFGFLFPGIDNWAHAGGFAGGYVVSALLNPLSRERGDHMLMAVVCLVASVASIVYAIIDSWTLIVG
ncbi:MAG: rhomboid family intramembrane serine protease [Vicinamibacterales bacterium]